VLTLPRGTVSTPVFMPVGTQASVKSLDPNDLNQLGAEIILANTYHLMLRPGADAIEQFGGVSRFMRWDRPVLTDSGGFQVFSLAKNRELDEEGVTFRSHLDGSLHTLTPERAVTLQMQFGSDIVMALDVCVGFDSDSVEQRQAMDLTHRWLPRNLERFRSAVDLQQVIRPLFFGIAQGGFDPARREHSARIISDSMVDGCAIGGLSVGEPKDVMAEMLMHSVAGLDDRRARYLMGVGSPEDLWNAVAAGVDMFDCVLPTRVARRGAVFTLDGRVSITTSRFSRLDEPVDPSCDCYACATFSAAYLHHLFKARELLGYRLASIHNLRFLVRQTEIMRETIERGTFEEAHQNFHDRYRTADQAVAAKQREIFRHRRSLTRS
jgi:queuine tRNA-ribosyltransferase